MGSSDGVNGKSSSSNHAQTPMAHQQEAEYVDDPVFYAKLKAAYRAYRPLSPDHFSRSEQPETGSPASTKRETEDSMQLKKAIHELQQKTENLSKSFSLNQDDEDRTRTLKHIERFLAEAEKKRDTSHHRAAKNLKNLINSATEQNEKIFTNLLQETAALDKHKDELLERDVNNAFTKDLREIQTLLSTLQQALEEQQKHARALLTRAATQERGETEEIPSRELAPQKTISLLSDPETTNSSRQHNVSETTTGADSLHTPGANLDKIDEKEEAKELDDFAFEHLSFSHSFSRGKLAIIAKHYAASPGLPTLRSGHPLISFLPPHSITSSLASGRDRYSGPMSTISPNDILGLAQLKEELTEITKEVTKLVKKPDRTPQTTISLHDQLAENAREIAARQEAITKRYGSRTQRALTTLIRPFGEVTDHSIAFHYWRDLAKLNQTQQTILQKSLDKANPSSTRRPKVSYLSKMRGTIKRAFRRMAKTEKA